MNLNIETVFSLKEKGVKDIKSWLTNVIENDNDFENKFNDFNILLLSECVNSKIFKSKTQQEQLEWAELYIYILSILDDIYKSPTHAYISQSMDLRIEMIKKYGDNPKKDILNLDKIKDWINLDKIKFEEIEYLHKSFMENRDKDTLYKYQIIRSKIFSLKKLLKYEFIKSNKKIIQIIDYIDSNSFFKSESELK
ncbi:hypothetical protein [Apibacter sp. HY039]|uniref:hypothetical protein n=1 Tax=Apibacter sp. HY039 TaxID=2501476 RepID=UPI000FEB986B|nr:hypothetical protein [Apibacter sp. HY039]